MAPRLQPNTAERMPTASAVREPNTMRLNTSRPYWSVPNQCASPGADSMAAKSISSG